MIIFDDAGYIAGVQSVLLERDVDMSVNDLTKQAEKFWKQNNVKRTAGVRARRVDGGGGVVHHGLLCRPPRRLQRWKVVILITILVVWWNFGCFVNFSGPLVKMT